MKTTNRNLAVATLFAAVAGAALAAPASEFDLNLNQPQAYVSSVARGDVRGTPTARNEFDRNQYPAAGRSAIPLQRVQVAAEARTARRLGLIPNGEAPFLAATPVQAEIVRQAGLAALQHRVASR